MTKRVLESNRELHFRVSLARHALGIDTVPTLDSVTKFATHLLSECEQLSQTEKKKPAPATKNEVKVKSLDYDKEESKGKGKGKERSFEDEKGERRRKCKFYLTTEGCRKGKECRYSHAERDGKRDGKRDAECRYSHTLVVQRSTWRQIALESRPLKDHHQSRRLRRLREIKFQEEPKDPKIKEERLRL